MSDSLTRPSDRPDVVNYSKVRVSVVEGPDKGLAHDLVNSTLTVGTSSDSGMVLTDGTVSRSHCSLEPVAPGLRIRDEHSTNGILMSGARVYDAVVTGPARLQLGDTVLAIEPLGETVAREQLRSDRFGDLLGRSPRMRELFADLQRIAPTDITLLIEGETGSGKELVAEAIHQASERAAGPLVVFDCSAVATSLAESELFGHERGAFTGAVGSRPGVFEQAHGGTLFIDELGELPKELQPKLLRALERRQIRRLGGQRLISVDVRIVAATNRNLPAEVRQGNFREDLYFRLATAHLCVPPLRDRMEDLELLTEHFLSRAKPRREINDVSPAVWEMFKAHRWPGNVRELSNAVQRLLVTPERPLGPGSQVRDTPVPTGDAQQELLPLRVARRNASDAFERGYLDAVLARTKGNVMRAAAIAEVSRQMLQKMMRKHDR